MKRGEVWLGKMNPSLDGQPGKVRPVLIVQSDDLIREGGRTIVVLPMTSRASERKNMLRVQVMARERLKLDSEVMVDVPVSLGRTKIVPDGPLTVLTLAEMAQVERYLASVLGLRH